MTYHKVDKLDRDTVEVLVIDAEREIRAEMRKYGLNARRQGRITFDAGTMTVKFEVTVPALKEVENGNLAEGLGLPADIVGTKFNSPTPTGRPRWYRIIEINLRRHRYPITAERIKDGKRFKFEVSYVKRQLKMGR